MCCLAPRLSNAAAMWWEETWSYTTQDGSLIFFATVLCATHDVKLVTLVTLVTLREQLSSGHNLQMEDPKVR